MRAIEADHGEFGNTSGAQGSGPGQLGWQTKRLRQNRLGKGALCQGSVPCNQVILQQNFQTYLHATAAKRLSGSQVGWAFL